MFEAVKESGYALEYVKQQTEEICLEAVKENCSVIQYIKEQTEEICLAAVKQNGNSLQYVKEQTPKICYEAVKQNGSVLQYVEEFYLELLELKSEYMRDYKEYFKKEIVGHKIKIKGEKKMEKML